MDLALDCRVLGRHAEGVPAHRMQHRKAHRPLHPRHHVAHRVVADVAHMDAPRRIGEHLQHVVFRLVRRGVLARRRIGRGEDAALVPDFLPAGLGLGGVVAVGSHQESQVFRLLQNSRDVTRKRTAGQRRPHLSPTEVDVSDFGRSKGAELGNTRVQWGEVKINHRSRGAIFCRRCRLANCFAPRMSLSRRSGDFGFFLSLPWKREKGSGTPVDADPYPPHPAVGSASLSGSSSPAGVPLAALAKGTFVPKAQRQAMLPGTRPERTIL